jgi:DNA-binding CsgD family transcriptional regulator
MLHSHIVIEELENRELSEREIEVLRLLAAGLSNKEIAGQLYLSVNTVKVHLRNIFAKLDVQSRTEATLVAIQRGWVIVPQSSPGEPAVERAPYAPADLPRIVTEPPLPVWRRVTLIAAAILCAAGIVVSGLDSTGGVVAAGDPFSDGSNDPSAGDVTSGDSAWEAAASMPTARARLAVVAHGNRLFAIGGDTQNGVTGVVERYDPAQNAWSSAAPKPTPVSNALAAGIGDQIFVPGGMTSAGSPTTAVEVYDVLADRWSSAAPLPAPRMAYAVASFDGLLYLMGGSDGSAFSTTLYVYDPGTVTWTTRAPMPTPRTFSAASLLGDAIYVVGGYDGQVESNVCERYLPREDRWETCPSMSVGRGGLALVTVGSNLYAIGGGWTGYLAFNEVLTQGASEWRPVSTPIFGQWRGLGAGVIDADILAVGGWNGQYLASTDRYRPFPFKVFVPAAQGDQ